MDPVIAIEGVTKRFGGTVAVDEVSVTVDSGEVLGLVGPNGSGKSTLINLISGVHKLDSGVIRFGGDEISRLPPHVIARLGIARTFQVVRPLMGLDLRHNVLVGSLYGSSGEGRRRRREESLRQADEALRAVGLYDRRYEDPSVLTSAELKLLEIARALAMNPKLLLLDEVMAGLNVSEVEQMTRLIKDVNRRGVAIIFIEHIMKPVMAVSHRVMVLHHGRRLALGSPEAVTADPAVIDAYLGARYGQRREGG